MDAVLSQACFGRLVNFMQTGAVRVCQLGASVLLIILPNYILDRKSESSFFELVN